MPRSRPRLLAALAAVAAAIVLVLGACGESSSGDPRSEALSYLPQGSPLVIVAQTDPKGSRLKSALRVVKRFGGSGQLFSQLERSLKSEGVDYSSDIEPLLGNPIAFSSTGSTVDGDHFVAAWVVADGEALDSLIDDQHLRKVGSSGDADIYQGRDDDGLFARDGETVVMASSRAEIDAALRRHDGDDHLRSADLSRLAGELPKQPLVAAYGDVSKLLASPDAAEARKIPWVAALKGYAVALSAVDDGLVLDFRLDTPGGTLGDDDVPIATGSQPPKLAGSAPVSAGIRDVGHVVAFIERALKLTDPSSYEDFQQGIAEVRRKAGVDLRGSVLEQLGDNLAAAVDTGGVMVRADLRSPHIVAAAIKRLRRASAKNPTGTLHPGPSGFVVIVDDGQPVFAGVADGKLVAGNASPGELRKFAGAPARDAPSARGAVAFAIDGRFLSQQLGSAIALAPALRPFVLGAIGDLHGYLAGSTSGLRGQVALDVK